MKMRATLLTFLCLFCLLSTNRLFAQTILPPIAEGVSAETCVLITELLYDPVSPDEQHEWFELTNICNDSIDLSGYKVGDEETRGQREGMVQFPDGTQLAAQRSIVIAQSATAFQAQWGFRPNFELLTTTPDVPTLLSVGFVDGVIQLANGGDELLLLDANNALVDGVSYGESRELLTPAVASVGRGISIGRVPANCDRDSAGDFQPQPQPNPGTAEFAAACAAAPAPAAPTDRPPIGYLQGEGAVSPLINQTVTFEGVVTGFHEDRNAAGTTFYTLFVQDLVGREDGNPLSSDAMPVFLGRRQPRAMIGDHVRVTGQLVEFYGFTEIADDGVHVEIVSHDNVLPSPIEVNPRTVNYEALEGMRVRLDFAPAQVIGPTFDGCGFTVARRDSGIERLYRRRADDPIVDAIPILFHSDVDCAALPNVKVGDAVSGLHGVLIYNFDQYKLLVQANIDLRVDSAPFAPLPDFPAPTEQQMSVVSLNVENLFDGVDDTGSNAEPQLSAQQIDIKLTKLTHVLDQLLHCPTVIALQEIETAALTQLLADRMAERCAGRYAVVHRDSPDGRGIDLAFLVDEARVVVNSAELNRVCTTLSTGITDDALACPPNSEPLFSRPPLILAATVDGQSITFVNNHFKSKRGGELETAPRREAQAAHLRDWAQAQLQQNRAAALVVLGDFNDYENSPPLQTLADGGLVNVLQQIPAEERYSFVFAGVSQLIDGIFVSSALESNVRFVSIAHINADYPDSLGAATSPERIAYRATDHDLPYLIFDLSDGEAFPTSEPTPLPLPTATPGPMPSADDEGSLGWGAGLAFVGLAALGGYWFGRRGRSV